MNELKAKLADLGLSDELSDQVLHTIGEYVKGRMPESFHSMIDEVLAGQSSQAAGILGSIAGLFGK